MDRAYVIFSGLYSNLNETRPYCEFEIYAMDYRPTREYKMEGSVSASGKVFGASFTYGQTETVSEHLGTKWDDYNEYIDDTQRFRTIEKFSNGNQPWYQKWFSTKNYCTYRVDECIFADACDETYGLKVITTSNNLIDEVRPE